MSEESLEEKQREYNIHLQCEIRTCHNFINAARDISRVLAMRSGGKSPQDKGEERRAWYKLGETMANLQIVLNTLDKICQHLSTENEALWKKIKEQEKMEIIPKEEWPEGEWRQEPDAFQWIDEVTGYNCEVVRDPSTGCWLGYVDAPYEDIDCQNHDLLKETIQVHGGVTYTRSNSYTKIYRVGFNTACEYFDLNPAHASQAPEGATYKNIDFVKAECTSLAKQLKKLKNQ